MRKYQSHKVVEAAQIREVDGETNKSGEFEWNLWWGNPDDDYSGYLTVSDDVMRRIMSGKSDAQELVGGYLVRYSDGYTSWSPAQPFEEGYTEYKGT